MKILIPAHGRDYTTATAARVAYYWGHDFILQDITSRWDGKPCSCRDFPNEEVKIRYLAKRRATYITHTGVPLSTIAKHILEQNA